MDATTTKQEVRFDTREHGRVVVAHGGREYDCTCATQHVAAHGPGCAIARLTGLNLWGSASEAELRFYAAIEQSVIDSDRREHRGLATQEEV